jgi:hypothetical protein
VAGLIQSRLRARRHLFPSSAVPDAPPPLTAEEQARVTELRAQAEKRLKLTRFLLAEDMPEEAPQSLHETARLIAGARAIEQRLGAEPATLAEALVPPHDRVWEEHADAIRHLMPDTPTPADLASAVEALATIS